MKSMKSANLKGKIGGAILGLALLAGIGMVSGSTAQAQWPWGRDQDRDYGRNRDDRYRRGGYNNGYDRGYQDGFSTGASDAQRGQSFNPERSHYYRNATDGYDRYYGDKEAYKEAYRDGFVRGYESGFRRYSGHNRGNNRRNDRVWRNGRWFPFPW